MRVKLWIQRDLWGRVVATDTDRSRLTLAGTVCETIKFREIGTWKQLVLAMLQDGSKRTLLDAAWRKAVSDGQVGASYSFNHGMPFDALTVQAARRDADVLDSYIAELVNNPQSRFYIYG